MYTRLHARGVPRAPSAHPVSRLLAALPPAVVLEPLLHLLAGARFREAAKEVLLGFEPPLVENGLSLLLGELAAQRPALAFHLEEGLDFGQAQADDFAQPFDEAQPLDVFLVIAAIAARDMRGWLEKADLLVVADGARREPGVLGDVADAAEARVDRDGQCASHAPF